MWQGPHVLHIKYMSLFEHYRAPHDLGYRHTAAGSYLLLGKRSLVSVMLLPHYQDKSLEHLQDIATVFYKAASFTINLLFIKPMYF